MHAYIQYFYYENNNNNLNSLKQIYLYFSQQYLLVHLSVVFISIQKAQKTFQKMVGWIKMTTY